MRRTLPVTAAILCGLLALTDFFVSEPTVDALGAALAEGLMILAGFALLLGILNILAVHGRRVAAGETDRGLSLVLIVALLGTLAVGVAPGGEALFGWVFNYVYYPLQATMAALLAFFVVSAAYRAFRVRSGEAAILLGTSLVLLVLQLPLVDSLWPYLARVREWIMVVPVTAGVRGILLGIALGTIATALRVLMAADQPYVQE